MLNGEKKKKKIIYVNIHADIYTGVLCQGLLQYDEFDAALL